jgi:hypothetical protein
MPRVPGVNRHGQRVTRRCQALRPEYHPNYYGAFVLDPDGHNIEAVFHGPA